MPYFNRSNLNSSAHENCPRSTDNQMWQVFANERQTFAAPKIHSLNPADKDYSCDHCKYKTDFKAYLDHHKKRIHMSQPGLWMCMTGTCRGKPSSFINHHQLKKHQQIECPECKKSFGAKRNMRRHVKHVHKGQIQELKWVKCGRKFKYWPIAANNVEIWLSILCKKQSN